MFDWIVGYMGSAGYFGLFALMLGENVFPPIPSELVMPLGGFLAAQGTLNIIFVVLAGTAGSVLGALIWYYVGKLIGEERLRNFAKRHGRWLTLSPREVDASISWFDKHGWKAVLIGRMIPGVRTLISVPAGIADMPLTPFLIYTSLGSLFWTAFLAAAGYLLESQYDKVASWVNPVSTAILVGAIAWYVFRVIKGTGQTEETPDNRPAD
ncbi:alkaline phosphatase [Brevirhabdus pacifica]|uniref:Alkaline phosphatase n=1 Tax=Brevirhabdus pacifica TaxID=1267768 RepID=A0A1U7DGH9_9RHOB|nr:DedA family protein [Brevirhabdus pacifica]APX89076.1 alkaline phosphatase [Brevirhabdus pacifica]OWU76861.1 alkaline phosphatase [Loktanella sp. 22II-4b]PJJ86346.1 membrane protein DedA with SNARE-associated domain [Brevirhabdus pacifica]